MFPEINLRHTIETYQVGFGIFNTDVD